MQEPRTTHIAKLGFALGHPRRVALLERLIARPASGRSLQSLEVETGLARGTLIHHLRVLEAARLVRRKPSGSATEYAAYPVPLADLSAVAHRLADHGGAQEKGGVAAAPRYSSAPDQPKMSATMPEYQPTLSS